MFCVKCGKPAKVDNFCTDCFLERHSLFDVKDLRLIYCDICGINEDEIIEKARQSIKTQNKLSGVDTKLRLVGNRAYVAVTCKGKIDGVEKTETKKIIVTVKKKMCDMHVKLSGGYYEAMIQIRGPDKEVILKKVMQTVPEKSITGIDEIKEGYNVKIMRKANAASAAKTLRNRFSVKQSYKVGGSKKGQMVYRNYYAVR